jgi:glycosyltransferase involved in cell wall biosynthesis
MPPSEATRTVHVRLLFVSQYFSPDITAAAFRIADTARHLAREGHEVFVITSVPHRGLATGSSTSDAPEEHLAVLRTKVIPPGRAGAVRYLACYSSFVVGSLFLGLTLWLRGIRPDAIWVTSPPLFAGLSGWGLAALFRRPFVLDVRDVWPDSAVAAGQISAHGLAFRIGKRLEGFLYSRARHITCVAEPMREYLAGRTNVAITVVYNGVPRTLAEVAPPDLPSPVPEGEVRTIVYAGNLGRVQELDLFVRTFAELCREDRLGEWHARLIGAGAVAAELDDLVRRLGVANRVSVEPPMTREDVVSTLRRADLLFLSLKRDPALRLTIPSKLFDCLLAGRPILAGIGGEGREILESTGANICYDPGDKQGLKRSLLEAATGHAELAAVADGNRKLVLERYTRDESARRLLKVLTVARAAGSGSDE